MRHVSATEAKQCFAAVLDADRREPVTIRRQNRNVVVLLLVEDYAKLARLDVEGLQRFGDGPAPGRKRVG